MKKVTTLLTLALMMIFTITSKADSKGTVTAVPTGLAETTIVHITNPVSGNFYSGTFNATIGGNNVKLYCIDLHHHLQWNTTYTDDGHTSPEITYILNNYYPYVTNRSDALSDVNKEAAAVQGAIWTFSDGLTDFTSPADVEARRLQIVADAQANAGNTTPALTLVITPQYQGLHAGVDAAFTIEAYDEQNAPAANVNVTLTTTDGTLSATSLTTGTNGITDTVYLTQGVSTTANVTASAVVTIPQGTKLVRADAPDDYQKLVLATPVQNISEVAANVRWFNETDLALVKTVDNAEPTDGDQITFTLTLSNNSNEDAYGIEVTDLLPTGLIYVSSTPSAGSYDANTGLWTLSELDANAQATLNITAQVDYATLNTTSLDLGPVADYNVFVLRNLTQPSSDTEGKMAVGRNATLSNYSVGDKLTTTGEDVLVAGRKLTFTSGRVYNGNAVYGRFQAVDTPRVTIDGSLLHQTDIDFGAAGAYLRNLSSQLRGYTVNGDTRFEWGGLTLTGNNPFLNVFNVNGDDLSVANNMSINAPNGSVVIVNISKRNVSWTGGASVTGTSKENVIYNFYQARHITLQGIDILGTILAPKASVNFVSGVQHGQMICKNLTGQGQFNLANFIGNIPVDPYITNTAEITALLNPESNTANNSSSVTVHINFNGSGSNGNNSNWQFVSSVGTEMIWTMTYDNSGNTLYGTWGGKIYRDNGNGAQVINPNMNVSFIWSIAVDPVNDKIWAATEQGVYISRDNGATWELRGLNGMDVRSIIAVGEDHVWASTWGAGVYELSSATGYNFVARNDGLSILAVHALAANSAGDIFAGTFGEGVMKLAAGSTQWTATPIGYDFVWALNVDSQDNIYAGTYGGGVYTSANAGDSWTQINNGLANNYIYSIAINPGDDVFASAWGSGVYQLHTSKGTNWAVLGMDGISVTSLITSAKDGSLYAATQDGKIYKYIDSPLAVGDEGNAAVKFDLSQNYPNPFNPTTNIKFTIAKQGNYKFVVYNLLGEEVAVLMNGTLEQGSHHVVFNGSNLASGIYVYSLQGEGLKITKKMVLMK